MESIDFTMKKNCTSSSAQCVSVPWSDQSSFVGFNGQPTMSVPITTILETIQPKWEKWILLAKDPRDPSRTFHQVASYQFIQPIQISNNYELFLREYTPPTSDHNLIISLLDLIPAKGLVTISATLGLLQSEDWTLWKSRFRFNEHGYLHTRWKNLDEGNRTLLKQGMQKGKVGVLQNWIYASWPHARLAGTFHHIMTNTEDYVSPNPQSYVRVIFHRDMFVSQSRYPMKKIGSPILDVQEEPMDSDSDSGYDSDPRDIIVSAESFERFKGQRVWILHGTRAHIDAFIHEHFCPNSCTKSFVKNGYAQYLISKNCL